MQLLPMASSPDGLISARYAVITKTPGWGGFWGEGGVQVKVRWESPLTRWHWRGIKDQGCPMLRLSHKGMW